MPRSTAQPSFASVVVKWSVAIAFCVIPATQAFGHAYVKYVSTPDYPTLGFSLVVAVCRDHSVGLDRCIVPSRPRP